jgi:import inner membrane translocase subunit TIM10
VRVTCPIPIWCPTDLFPSHRTCHAKCISARYAEAELNKGESVCIDRCVSKYFAVNKEVGEKLQAVGANAQTGAQGGGSSMF